MVRLIEGAAGCHSPPAIGYALSEPYPTAAPVGGWECWHLKCSDLPPRTCSLRHESNQQQTKGGFKARIPPA
jgi:hypothetical protein